MVVVCQIVESYSQKVLVEIPDDTPNAEQKARNYVEHRYNLGDMHFDFTQADYIDQSGEVSVAYSGDGSKFGKPDFKLNEKGEEYGQEKSNS